MALTDVFVWRGTTCTPLSENSATICAMTTFVIVEKQLWTSSAKLSRLLFLVEERRPRLTEFRFSRQFQTLNL